MRLICESVGWWTSGVASSNLSETWKNKRVKWVRIISLSVFGLVLLLVLDSDIDWNWVSSLQTANPAGISQSPRPWKLISYNISIYIYTLQVYVYTVAMYKYVPTYINIHIAHTNRDLRRGLGHSSLQSLLVWE